MTLAKGNKLVKLDEKGRPMTLDNPGEVWVEYEVAELTPYTTLYRQREAPSREAGDLAAPVAVKPESYVVVLLRKLR